MDRTKVLTTCPHCSSKYAYTVEHIDENNRVNCQNCGSEIEAEGHVVEYGSLERLRMKSPEETFSSGSPS